MADEKPSLHIDSDWKKQAQEEKRKLAEEQQKAASAAKPAAPADAPTARAADRPAGRATSAGRQRQIPAASFASIVQSMATQALYSLSDAESHAADPALSLDLAKHHIDSLGILEQKTKGNLGEDESKLLETMLYQVRMQFVQVASRFSL